MKQHRQFVLCAVVALFLGAIALAPLAAAAPAFTITAANVIISSSGTGSSQFTVTGIPVTGTIVLSCGYSGSLALGGLPICPLTPPAARPVTAGGTLTGVISFYPPNTVIPASVSEVGLALAGALLVGFGLRRRARWPLAMLLVALGSLAGLMGVSACGGHSSIHMPKGTYPYTITAVDSPSAGTGPTYVASTIIQVTVP
jgi:hypothetical protein